jgi:hypothetical protein
MKKRKMVAYGYVGEWKDGDLGWFLPRHLCDYDTIDHPSPTWPTFESAEGELGVLCKITLEEIPGKRRRRVKKA